METNLKKSITNYLKSRFSESSKPIAIREVQEHLKNVWGDLKGRTIANNLMGTPYTIKTRGTDGEKFIVPVDRKRYQATRIIRDEDVDASISFGLTISILRVERHADKKVVPFEMQIRWFFWKWRQFINIFL